MPDVVNETLLAYLTLKLPHFELKSRHILIKILCVLKYPIRQAFLMDGIDRACALARNDEGVFLCPSIL